MLDSALRIDQVSDLEQLRAAAKGRRQRMGAAGDSLQVDLQDRESVRRFFNGIYLGIPEAPMNWTGSYATGAAGTVSQAYQDSTALRINWFRAMAGVPSNVTLDANLSAKDQEAAMMMSVNGKLSHYPDTSWKSYTAAGADAAGHSNLSMAAGVQGIDSYIFDYGDSNAPLGHRRWVLYPQNTYFGSGSVPGGTVNGVTYYGANALWTVTAEYGGVRPKVRDDYVAWPPRGYVPYQVVYPRWSISYPNADFKQAKVVMTLAGANVPVVQEEVHDGYGENTLAWKLSTHLDDMPRTKPAADQRYSVTVSNVYVQGKPVTYSYDVVVFDPATATPNAIRTTVLPPAQATLGTSSTMAVEPMAGASGYQIRQYQRRSVPATSYNPANAAGAWLSGSPVGYDPLAGARFSLRHTSDFRDPSLVYASQLMLGSGASISFTRSTGYAALQEVLRVQVSEDDGSSWSDAYSEAGTDSPSSARQVQVSLAAYAGRKIKLRLAVTQSGRVYTCSDCGWNVSDIALRDSSALVNEQTYAVPASGSIAVDFDQAGDYVLYGRTQYQSLYYGDWGPGASLYVDGAVFTGKRANYSVTKTDAGYVFTDMVGNDGVQTVRNPFRLNFTDVSLAFDVDGKAGAAYRLYQAAFNRKPDAAGLGYWLKALDGNTPAIAIAAAFTASKEFKDLYGQTPTKDQLVRAMYNNTLHREGDAGGYNYWLNALNSGLTPEGLLLNFADSQENRQQVAPAINLGIEYVRY
nr:DUF4214 domain-containing protein [Duganella rivi]